MTGCKGVVDSMDVEEPVVLCHSSSRLPKRTTQDTNGISISRTRILSMTIWVIGNTSSGGHEGVDDLNARRTGVIQQTRRL